MAASGVEFCGANIEFPGSDIELATSAVEVRAGDAEAWNKIICCRVPAMNPPGVRIELRSADIELPDWNIEGCGIGIGCRGRDSEDDGGDNEPAGADMAKQASGNRSDRVGMD